MARRWSSLSLATLLQAPIEQLSAPLGNYEDFEIIGTVNADLISVVVNWGVYGSITAWVGEHTEDDDGANERIVTMWHLVKNVAETIEDEALWGAFLTGSHSFRRVP